jgi:hypothetical protein
MWYIDLTKEEDNMAYVNPNFKSKAALKRAITEGGSIGVFQPGFGTVPLNGKISLEGPHYPAAHTWYGTGTIVDGKLVKVS